MKLKNEVIRTIKTYDVPSNHLHVEQFVASITEPLGTLHQVDITLIDGQKLALNVASNQTILEVAKFEGVMILHACGAGTCGTCKFKVDKGQVYDIPDSIPGITADEREAGYTLACQCRPQSSVALSGL